MYKKKKKFNPSPNWTPHFPLNCCNFFFKSLIKLFLACNQTPYHKKSLWKQSSNSPHKMRKKQTLKAPPKSYFPLTYFFHPPPENFTRKVYLWLLTFTAKTATSYFIPHALHIYESGGKGLTSVSFVHKTSCSIDEVHTVQDIGSFTFFLLLWFPNLFICLW